MAATRKRVILYGDGTRPDAQHAIAQVLPLVRERADIVAVCTDRSLDLARERFDLLMNFGGDGSMLGAVRSMGINQIPVVGVNFGKVGFLSAFELPDLLANLDDILEGRVLRRESIILEAHVAHGTQTAHETSIALNDVVISRGALSRILKLRCTIDGAYVTSYHVDGIIVSSPIGSTAHSLSAGGPVMEPEMNGMIIAPICPHTLAVRPLVVNGTRQVELEVQHATGDFGVTFDGQVFVPLAAGDRVTIRAFSRKFTLLCSGPGEFYRNLRSKLLWGGHIERGALSGQ